MTATTLVDFVRSEIRRIWFEGQLYGSEFTFADVDEVAKAHAARFPAHSNHKSQQAVLRRMLQDERRKSVLVFVKRGIYRYDTSPKKDRRRTVTKYEVQPKKAKNIRKLFDVGPEVPVRYARKALQFPLKPEDYKGAIIGDDASKDPYCKDGCIEHKCLIRHSLPSVNRYRETAVRGLTERGKDIITIYATDLKPKRFDDKHPTPGVMALNKIPDSWLPEKRREFAEKRTKRLAKGGKPRKYVKTGSFAAPDPMRPSHF